MGWRSCLTLPRRPGMPQVMPPEVLNLRPFQSLLPGSGIGGVPLRAHRCLLLVVQALKKLSLIDADEHPPCQGLT